MGSIHLPSGDPPFCMTITVYTNISSTSVGGIKVQLMVGTSMLALAAVVLWAKSMDIVDIETIIHNIMLLY